MSYWATIEYIGAGFVIQRQKENDGSDKKDYSHEDGYTARERVVHIADANGIHTSSIDVERLE